MTRKADIFDVWGSPPQALMRGLTSRHVTVLKRYTEALAGRAYELGFDCGVDHAFSLVSETVTDKFQKQKAKRRSTARS